MRVSEAVKRWGKVLGTEIEIEGIAEISNSMSVIYEYKDKREVGDPITLGILIHGNHLLNLVESLPKPPAAHAGSEILYVVKVRILGIVANTGHTFAPLKFGHIYEIEFNDNNTGIQKITVNMRLKDVTFKLNRKLKVSEVKEFEKYFPSFENLIKLKKHLESGDTMTLVNRVLENELTEYLRFLNRLNIKYEINNSPIENGFFGMP